MLKNRLVRSATFEAMGDDEGNVTQSYVDLHRALAAGGAGLIVTGMAFVQPAGKLPHAIGADRDDRVAGLRRVTEACMAPATECRIVLQLGHVGRQLPRRVERETVAPSAVAEPATGRSPREMSAADIEECIDAFVRGIRRARDAGFDGVQLHAAHGWLLSSFLSPHTNRRQDTYGGTTANRCRILLEIRSRAAELVGPDFPCCVKINAHDFVEGGIELVEALEIGSVLAGAGYAALEVSSSMWETLLRKREEIGWAPAILPEARVAIDSKAKEAYHRSFARAFKKRLPHVPIILVGGLRSPDIMDEILVSGDADLVSMCRPLDSAAGLASSLADRRHGHRRVRFLQCLHSKPKADRAPLPETRGRTVKTSALTGRKRLDKVMSAADAISQYVHDGDMLASANFLSSLPSALVHEVIRQNKRRLTYVAASSLDELEFLAAGGCVDKAIISFQMMPPGVPDTAVERAIRSGALRTRTVHQLQRAGHAGSRRPGKNLRCPHARADAHGHLRAPRFHGRRQVQGDHLPVHRQGCPHGPCAPP